MGVVCQETFTQGEEKNAQECSETCDNVHDRDSGSDVVAGEEDGSGRTEDDEVGVGGNKE